MDKKEFKTLNVDQRAEYFNGIMKDGASFNKVCKSLNISTSQYEFLKKNGYRLDKVKNQFIKEQLEGQKNLFENTEPKEKHDIATGTGTIIDKNKIDPITEPQEEKKELNNINAPCEDETIEKADNEVKRSVGRPQKHLKDEEGKSINKSKITLEIDNNIVKALRLKKVLEGLTINSYIEQLLKDNIEPKYFDIVEK